MTCTSVMTPNASTSSTPYVSFFLNVMHETHAGSVTQLHDLLFQLHIVSFFLAPSLVPLVTRAMCCQFLCYKPREIDPKISLRSWFLLTFFLNFPSFWLHAREGTGEGRTVVLDFVGMGAFITLLAFMKMTTRTSQSMHPLKCTSFCSTSSSWFSYCCWRRSRTRNRYSSHPPSSPRFSFNILSSQHRHSHTRTRMNSQNLPVVNEHT
jgi:hypothetical protein